MFYSISDTFYLKNRTRSNFFCSNVWFSSKSGVQKKFLLTTTLKNVRFKHTQKLKKKFFFFKFDRVVCKRARWAYNSKFFRNSLQLRNRVHQYFDGVFSNLFFKKELKKQFLFLDYIRYSFIKPEFRLDILLWRLNFFSSPYSARIAVLKNEITVNGSFVRFSYFLKQGDVVVVKKCKNLKFLRSLKIMKFSLNSFVEIDYYSNTFIVLQDYSTMGVDTFPSIIRQPLKASAYLGYLRLK